MAHSNVPARWLLGGAGALALGSFLPWAEVGPFSVSGTDGDGVLTLGFGVLIAVVAWPSMQKAIGRGRSITASIAAGLALVVCVYDVLNVSSSDNDFIEAEVGIGLWVCTAGAIAVIVGLVLGAKREVVRFGASPPGTAGPEPAVAAPTADAPSAERRQRPVGARPLRSPRAPLLGRVGVVSACVRRRSCRHRHVRGAAVALSG